MTTTKPKPKIRSGRKAQHVYAIGKVAFVPHPSGLWLRTDICVLKIACEVCRARICRPCRDRDGEPVSYTHYQWRSAGKHIDIANSATIITVHR